MKRHLSMFALAFLLASSVAWAKGQHPSLDRLRAECDTRVQLVAARLASSFTAIDSDHDGVISRAEATTGGVRADCFRHLDRDRDGRVSAAEIARLS